MMMLPPPGVMVEYPRPYFAHSSSSGAYVRTPLPIPLPPERQNGDLCVITLTWDNEGNSVQHEDGFIENYAVNGGFPNGTSSRQYMKVLDGTEPETLSWNTNLGGFVGWVWSITLVRGGTGNTAFNYSANQNTTTPTARAVDSGETRARFRCWLASLTTSAQLVSYSNEKPLARTSISDTLSVPDITVAHQGSIDFNTADDGSIFVQSTNVDTVTATLGAW